jgi:hypothetical protein
MFRAKTGISKKIRDFIGDKKVTRAQVVAALPEFEPESISGTLSSLVRYKFLYMTEKQKPAIYSANPIRCNPEKHKESLVRPFVGNVFSKPLGKVPHILDPRRDHKEREQLAMMVR